MPKIGLNDIETDDLVHCSKATPAAFKGDRVYKCWYNRGLDHGCAGLLYSRGKPSIEPVFALIKELFDLKAERQLPYKGLVRVEAYLMLATGALQVRMIFNSIHQYPLQATKPFRLALD